MMPSAGTQPCKTHIFGCVSWNKSRCCGWVFYVNLSEKSCFISARWHVLRITGNSTFQNHATTQNSIFRKFLSFTCYKTLHFDIRHQNSSHLISLKIFSRVSFRFINTSSWWCKSSAHDFVCLYSGLNTPKYSL